MPTTRWDICSGPRRPYELPARASWESSGVALTSELAGSIPENRNATSGAVQWFHDNVILNKSYIYETPGHWENGNIVDSEGAMMWYRFYNLTDNQFFMSGRNSEKVYDTDNLSFEMRTSYTWGGDWARDLFLETSKMGFKSN